MGSVQQGAHDQGLLVGYELLQLVIFGGGANGPPGVQHALVQHEHLLKEATNLTVLNIDVGLALGTLRLASCKSQGSLGGNSKSVGTNYPSLEILSATEDMPRLPRTSADTFAAVNQPLRLSKQADESWDSCDGALRPLLSRYCKKQLGIQCCNMFCIVAIRKPYLQCLSQPHSQKTK